MSNIFSFASSLKNKEHESTSLEILSGETSQERSMESPEPELVPLLWDSRILAPSPILGNQGLPQKCILRRALLAALCCKSHCHTWIIPTIIQSWSPLPPLLQSPHPSLRLSFFPDFQTPCSSRNHWVLHQGRFATFLYLTGSAWVTSSVR